jgi:YD repeat-containing protein
MHCTAGLECREEICLRVGHLNGPCAADGSCTAGTGLHCFDGTCREAGTPGKACLPDQRCLPAASADHEVHCVADMCIAQGGSGQPCLAGGTCTGAALCDTASQRCFVPRCGDGILTGSEACDDQRDCPAGWGMCKRCLPDCSGRALRLADRMTAANRGHKALGQIDWLPFCDQVVDDAVVERNAYDASGRLLKVERRYVNALRLQRELVHLDAEIRVTEYDVSCTTGCAGRLTVQKYDSAGRLLSSHAATGASDTNIVTYDYGEAGAVQATVSNGRRITNQTDYFYGPDGVRLARVDGDSWDMKYEYDALGRLVHEEWTDGGAWNRTVEHVWSGSVLSRTNTVMVGNQMNRVIEDVWTYDSNLLPRTHAVKETGYQHEASFTLDCLQALLNAAPDA